MPDKSTKPSPDPPETEPSARRPAVHAGTLHCDVCGHETPHRILHLDRGSSPRHPSGIARCQTCRTTHPFVEHPPHPVPVRVIISEGNESQSAMISIPSDVELAVNEVIPDQTPELRIRRIDLPDGRSAPTARPSAIGAVWATVYRGAIVPVSIVDGPTTEARRLVLPPEQVLTVGSSIRVGRETFFVSGMRARERTWTREGDAFPAERVQRVYARRTRNPPEGSSAWSAFRDSPSSRARPTSASARSRSSPGSTKARTSPRARSEGTGAATHRGDPS
jgi:uncharacterized Zn finger protein